MTEAQVEIVGPDAPTAAAEEEAPRSLAGQALDNIRTGNLGILPIVIGLAIIILFFSFKATNFFTANNFNNIIIQLAGTCMLAFGVVFVLLLGEIDLSIGYLSGLAAVAVAELQLPGSNHDFPFSLIAPVEGILAIVIAVAIAGALGAAQGTIVAKVGVPSFVVTLAGLLIFQGLILQVLEVRGTILIQDHWINDTAYYYFSAAAGWLIAAIVSGVYAVYAIAHVVGQRRAGLAVRGPFMLLAKVVGLAIACFGVVAICNHATVPTGLPARRRPRRHLPRSADLPGEAHDVRASRLRRRRERRGGEASGDQRRPDPDPRLRDLGRHGRRRRDHPCRERELRRPQRRRRHAAPERDRGGCHRRGEPLRRAGARCVARSSGSLVIVTVSNGLNTAGYKAGVIYVITGFILLLAVMLDTIARRLQVRSGR